MKHDRRQDILKAAMDLFAKKGFRGTTTRDLATQADVNEAIIFRHFKTKEELYSAILEHKAVEIREAQTGELERLASSNEDEKFFREIAKGFLERHQKDTTFLRLMLYSALEGHQLSEMAVTSMAARNPVAKYIQRRIVDGAFRELDPELASRAFMGMFASFVMWQDIFGLKKNRSFNRDEVVHTFVSIFLNGLTKE